MSWSSEQDDPSWTTELDDQLKIHMMKNSGQDPGSAAESLGKTEEACIKRWKYLDPSRWENPLWGKECKRRLSEAVEAQQDQPTDSNDSYKTLPKEVPSSMAWQIPNPQVNVAGRQTTTTEVMAPGQQVMPPPSSASIMSGQQQQQEPPPTAVIGPISSAGCGQGLAKLPTQPLPLSSLKGVVQVTIKMTVIIALTIIIIQIQPSTASTLITPQGFRPQAGMRPPVPGGIPGQLPASNNQQVQPRTVMQQQQQQPQGSQPPVPGGIQNLPQSPVPAWVPGPPVPPVIPGEGETDSNLHSILPNIPNEVENFLLEFPPL